MGPRRRGSGSREGECSDISFCASHLDFGRVPQWHSSSSRGSLLESDQAVTYLALLVPGSLVDGRSLFVGHDDETGGGGRGEDDALDAGDLLGGCEYSESHVDYSSDDLFRGFAQREIRSDESDGRDACARRESWSATIFEALNSPYVPSIALISTGSLVRSGTTTVSNCPSPNSASHLSCKGESFSALRVDPRTLYPALRSFSMRCEATKPCRELREDQLGRSNAAL